MKKTTDEYLKDEFERLRGKPITEFAPDSETPSIEVSDVEKLCRNPVVSVRMTTFNHEKFIAEAIEGVVNQVCDFRFELVIGEDCSTDRTREICFDYQKRYPEIIRVLYSEFNLHSSSTMSNGRRCINACRGEYIAICEGDDYWCDPEKLQKQIDVFRVHLSVALVFSDKFNRNDLDVDLAPSSLYEAMRMPDGLIKREKFYDFLNNMGVIPTASAVYRARDYAQICSRYRIFKWKLAMGDIRLWYGLSCMGDVYHFSERMIIYRVHAGGVSHNKKSVGQVFVDGTLPRIYFDVMLGKTTLHMSGDIMYTLVGRMRQVEADGFRVRLQTFLTVMAVGRKYFWLYNPLCLLTLVLYLAGCSGRIAWKPMKLTKLRWKVLKRIAPRYLWGAESNSLPSYFP